MHEGDGILDTADGEEDHEHYDQASTSRKDILNVCNRNLTQNRPIQFGMDNIDCSKESAIVGHSSGFHVTQMIAYQPGPPSQVGVSEMKFSQPTLEVPEVLQEIQEIQSPIIKQPPYVITKDDIDNILDRDTLTPGKKAYSTALAKDIAFHIRRQSLDRSKDCNANWTDFNKTQSTHADSPAAAVGLMPVLNAKADDHNTILTCAERMKAIADNLTDPEIWCITDQAINAPAHEVKWTKGEEWDNVHFRMGGLHISTNFMSAVGDHICGSELPQLWVDSGVATEGQVDKLMKGKDYKAGLRLHKLTWQATWRLLIPEFIDFIKN